MPIGTTIDGLNAVTSLTTNDEMPVWDKEASGEPTKKITASNLASSVKSLASLPNTTEMNAAIAQSTALYNNTAISAVSVSSGTFVTMETITPPEDGNYIIDTNASFSAGNGIRILLVDTAETDVNTSTNSVLAEGRATLQKIRTVHLTTSDRVYVRAYQNSGSAMSVSGSYRLLRVSN